MTSYTSSSGLTRIFTACAACLITTVLFGAVVDLFTPEYSFNKTTLYMFAGKHQGSQPALAAAKKAPKG